MVGLGCASRCGSENTTEAVIGELGNGEFRFVCLDRTDPACPASAVGDPTPPFHADIRVMFLQNTDSWGSPSRFQSLILIFEITERDAASRNRLELYLISGALLHEPCPRFEYNGKTESKEA